MTRKILLLFALLSLSSSIHASQNLSGNWLVEVKSIPGTAHSVLTTPFGDIVQDYPFSYNPTSIIEVKQSPLGELSGANSSGSITETLTGSFSNGSLNFTIVTKVTEPDTEATTTGTYTGTVSACKIY